VQQQLPVGEQVAVGRAHRRERVGTAVPGGGLAEGRLDEGERPLHRRQEESLLAGKSRNR
jgi:hypothetical protein